MKKILFSLFLSLAFLAFASIAKAETTSLGADAHCDHPWFYNFNFSGQANKIEHCGRQDSGSLDYTITATQTGEVWIYYEATIRNTSLRLTADSRSASKTVSGTGVWKTGLTVDSGEKVSLLADMKDRPYSGWTSPKGDVCNGFSGAGNLGVSNLYDSISQDGSKLISAQCWGDGYAHEKFLKESYNKPNVNITRNGSAKDCHDVLIEDMDFNDGAFFIAVSGQVAHKSSCDGLAVVSGNNSIVPAKMTFEAKASDNAGSIQAYRFFFGDNQKIETSHNRIDHTFESSGRFHVLVEVKDSKNNWLRSDECETTVTVKPVNIESHKSSCSYLYITEGQNHQAPSLVKFKVAGYDNKGGVKAYRIDYGDGQKSESDGQTFEHVYNQNGTYTAKAEIKDSTDQWRSDDDCEQTVYVSTKPITKQPSTGTPTWLSLVGLGGGLLAGSYPFIQGTKNMNRSLRQNKSRVKKRK